MTIVAKATIFGGRGVTGNGPWLPQGARLSKYASRPDSPGKGPKSGTPCTWAHDQPLADFDAREERVLKVERELLATWLGQLASAAGPRSPACPQCGVHSLNSVRRRRKPRTVNSRCGTVHVPRVRLTCRGCGHSWLPLQSVLGLAAKQRTSGGLQHWEALLGGLTTLRLSCSKPWLGWMWVLRTLRTHAEAAGTELEGAQRAAMAHVEATQEPPARYAPLADDQILIVEADGVMARYRDRHLDGTLIDGEWHEIKLGLVGGYQDGELVDASYVAARETASTFAPRLGTEAARRGALDIVAWRGRGTDGGGEEAVLRRVVVIGDGARWIWEHVATTFGSERVEILDWYHCCQHLGAIGTAVKGQAKVRGDGLSQVNAGGQSKVLGLQFVLSASPPHLGRTPVSPNTQRRPPVDTSKAATEGHRRFSRAG